MLSQVRTSLLKLNPISSMYEIFIYIHHKFKPHVGMEHMGMIFV